MKKVLSTYISHLKSIVLTILLLFIFEVETFSQTFADKDYYLVDSLNLSSLTRSDSIILIESLDKFHSSIDDTSKINSLNNICENMMNDAWVKYQFLQYEMINEAIANNPDKSTQHTLLISLASSLNNIGYIEKKRGNIAEALASYKSSLDVQDKVNNKEGRAETLGNIGVIYKNLGDSELAISYYQKSMSIHKELKDEEGVSMILNNIGMLYLAQDDLDEALIYHLKSLKIREKLNSKKGIALSCSNLGLIYNEMEESEISSSYYERGLKIYQEIGDQSGIAIGLHNLGSIFIDQLAINSYSEDSVRKIQKVALTYFLKSLEIKEAINDKKGIAESCFDIGWLYLEFGDKEKSLLYSEKSYKLAQELGYPERIRNGALLMSTIYAKQNKGMQAYNHYKIYIKMRDSLSNEKIRKQTYKKEISFQFKQKSLTDSLINIESEKVLHAQIETEKAVAAKEKKEKEQNILWTILGASILTLIVFFLIRANGIRKKNNMMLSDKNAEIEKTSHKLSETLGERNLLLKEIHHRVKNNLQTVSSLLSLQSRYLDDPNATKALKESQNRLLSISLLHQKLYQNENQPVIVFSEYLKELCEQVKNTCSKDDKEIEVEIVSDDLTCDIELAMPLGLIVNELMTNSYKYAFKDKKTGKITVSFCTLGEGKFQLEVKDNGIGLPEGFSMNHKNSMGLNLVKLLTKQLKGKITIAGNEGASFTLNFEKKKYR